MNNNPVYSQCPARMQDCGRPFTDFRPSCTTENAIMLQNNLNNSYEYRLFLQENGEALMQLNRQYAEKQNYCKPCGAKQVTYSQMTPLQN